MYYTTVMLRSAISCFLLVFSCITYAQQTIPALEREITLKAVDLSISQLLSKVSAQTGIQFSYSPSAIQADKKVTLSFTEKPVRTVLSVLFGESVQYRQKGNFIILTTRPSASSQHMIKQVMISGYVYDDKGDKLASASILNKTEHLSAVTNKYGYYKMQVPSNRFPVKLKIEKQNYIDTTLNITSSKTEVDVILTPHVKKQEAILVSQPIITTPLSDTTQAVPIVKVVAVADSIKAEDKKMLPWQWLLSPEVKANIVNLRDTLFSKVQVSLVPYVSTNSFLVGNTINTFSLNILAGYSQGLHGVELGGLANIDRGDVKYVQLAGICNAVGGNMTGVQYAGTININKGYMYGVQGAGTVNINGGYLYGVQTAGLLNITKEEAYGVQLAGWSNYARKLKGLQIAGTVNMALDSAYGVQVAGTVNYTRYMQGVQVAGLVNYAGKGTTWQLSGLVNYSGERAKLQIASLVNKANTVHTWQISGLINEAKHVKGGQLGIINLAGTCDGVPIGLLSFVKNGYHKIEVYGDEVLHTQLAFRTGVQKFHNILTAGIRPESNKYTLWGFGYGIGSSFNMGAKWKFTTDLISQVILKNDEIEKSSQLNSAFIGVERLLGKKCSVAFGPAYRVLLTYNAAEANPEASTDLVPYSFYNNTFSNGTNLTMWVGGKVSFKFL
jgi:hypothetical protein